MSNMPALNHGAISRMILSATAEDFTGVLSLLSNIVESTTGEKPSLKIAFYKASTSDGAPDRLIAEVRSIDDISRKFWCKADLVRAEFRTVANDAAPAVTGTLETKWPDRREIVYKITPESQGNMIGKIFMNGGNPFMFWTRRLVL